ncbi:oxygenase MpaB family protein [Nocardia sp. NPDC050175]|uniref:oxygenase MpaB family protein n=1 Tax=Nocardia sp. NPDC050175 TaxID=3364317 RepID=UPI0037A38911
MTTDAMPSGSPDRIAGGHSDDGADHSAARQAAFARFRWYNASVLKGLFAAALFDQTMLPTVSAGVESTGRIRFTPFERAFRTAAADQLAFWSEDPDRSVEFERLKRLHRDVKGVGYNGIRYSALNPESWNWILYSTIFMMRNAYTPITGEELSEQDDQFFWEFVTEAFSGLELPGRGRLPATYVEALHHYDEMVRTKLRRTKTLDNVVESLLSPPVPEFLPRVSRPMWSIVGPVIGHIVFICSFGIMHPDVRKMAPVEWTRLNRFEFQVAATLLPLAYRYLPKRLQYSPLAYNRWRYEQLVARYQAMGLDSFAPPPGGLGCPFTA